MLDSTDTENFCHRQQWNSWSTLEGEVKVLVIEFAMPRTTACQVPLSMAFSEARILERCHSLLHAVLFPTQGLDLGPCVAGRF